MNKNSLKKYVAAGVTAFVVIALSIIFYFCFDRIVGLRSFFSKVFSALMPVTWGIIIAYLLTPVYNVLHRHLYPLLSKRCSEKVSHSISKGVSIALSLLLLLCIVYALVAMIVPQLIDSILNIWESAPGYISEVRMWLFRLLENQPELRSEVMNIFNRLSSSALTKVDEYFQAFDFSSDSLKELLSQFGSVLTTLSSRVYRLVTALKNLIIGLIIAIYILATKKKMSAQAKKLLYAITRRKVANVVVEQAQYAHKVFSGFISGKLLDSLIIGALCFAGCSILRIPYALLVSVVVGITNIIPVFGPFIGAIPSALFILLISPIKCLTFIIFIIVLQQIDGNIIGPKILGSSTGLNSFWVIFALLLFGGLFGVAGMLLGVPVFAVFYHLVDEGCKALLTRKGLSPETDDYILLTRVEEDGYQRSVDPAYEAEPAEEASTPGEPKDNKDNPVIHWFTKLREDAVHPDSDSQEPQENQDPPATTNEPNGNEGSEQ
jgi:predicted PurR-regulated permease PerM